MSDDDDKKVVRKKISDIFSGMLDTFAAHQHERLRRSFCIAEPVDRRHRLRTIIALSAELERIRKENISATAIGEHVIEAVIEGDWKYAEECLGDLVTPESGEAHGKRWESFIAIGKTAVAESRRLSTSVRFEGN